MDSCSTGLVGCIAIAIVIGGSVSAAAPGPSVPRSAFYAGIGGGYASTHFGTQNIYAIGTSDVYLNSTGQQWR
ncbi:MAG: hypothetical protein ABWY07_05060 [Burkholderiales bacterium]